MAYKEYYEIARLLALSITGEISEIEKTTLDSWRAGSPENEDLYRELHDTEKRLTAKDIYLYFGQKTTAQDVIKMGDRRNRKRILTSVSKIAAAASVIIAVGITMYSRRTIEESPIAKNTIQLILSDGSSIDLEDYDGLIDLGTTVENFTRKEGELSYDDESGSSGELYNELFVGRGKKYRVKLSDGTQVWLNSDSYLHYPVSFFGVERRVVLKGEGYFEVAHSPEKPFVVDAGLYNVAVLGTEFNVSNHADLHNSRMVLVSGKVSVRREAGGEEVVINPGQSYYVDAVSGTSHIEEVDVRRYTSWKEGRYRYYEERLDDIMASISRLYDIEIIYSDEDLKEIQMSFFAAHSPTIDPLIDIFNEHGKIKVKKEGNSLYISRGR